MLRTDTFVEHLQLDFNPQIRDKGVKYVADALAQNLVLRDVSLRGCHISEAGVFILAFAMIEQKKLQDKRKARKSSKVKVEKEKEKQQDSEGQVQQEMSQAKGLKRKVETNEHSFLLDLDNNYGATTKPAIATLAQMLAFNPRVEMGKELRLLQYVVRATGKLTLANRKLKKYWFRQITQGLKWNNQIEELELTGKKMNQKRMDALLAVLEQGHRQAAKAGSEAEAEAEAQAQEGGAVTAPAAEAEGGADLEKGGSDGAADAPGDQRRCRIHTLHLDHCDITDAMACQIAELLQVNRTLTCVNLDHNERIGIHAQVALLKAVQDIPTIASLGEDFAWMLEFRMDKPEVRLNATLMDGGPLAHIRRDAVNSIARKLKHNAVVTLLDLSGNSLDDQLAGCLAASLGQNTALTEIALTENDITDDGAGFLAHMLRRNSTLRALHLDACLIGCDASRVHQHGVESLGEALDDNTTVTRITLEDNELSQHSAAFSRPLRTKLARNAAIAELFSSPAGERPATLALVDHYVNEVALRKILGGLTNGDAAVTELDLSDNGTRFGAGCAKLLAAFLASPDTNGSIAALRLRNDDLGPAGNRDLAAALKQNAAITELDLSANGIGYMGATVLAGVLAHEGCAIATLNISGNNIRDLGTGKIAEALAAPPRGSPVRALTCRDNSVKDAGARAMAGALASPNCALTLLDLNANKGITPQALRSFSEALDANVTVQTIHVGDHHFEQWAHAVQVRKKLERNHTLRALRAGAHRGRALMLDDRYVNALAARAAAAGLRAHPVAKVILSHNRVFDDDGAEALAGVLAEQPAITHVVLRASGIGPAGAGDLGDALKAPGCGVVRLDLSMNDIGGEGLRDLSQALAANETVTVLDVSECGVGDAGAQDVGAMLRLNTKLRLLALRDNDLTAAGAAALAQGLQSNETLVSLDLSGNHIGRPGAEQLAAVVCAKPAEDASLKAINLRGNGLPGNMLERFEAMVPPVLDEEDEAQLQEEMEDMEAQELRAEPAEAALPSAGLSLTAGPELGTTASKAHHKHKHRGKHRHKHHHHHKPRRSRSRRRRPQGDGDAGGPRGAVAPAPALGARSGRRSSVAERLAVVKSRKRREEAHRRRQRKKGRETAVAFMGTWYKAKGRRGTQNNHVARLRHAHGRKDVGRAIIRSVGHGARVTAMNNISHVSATRFDIIQKVA